ncbi:MAG: allophanate hydrolase subunit 1, partial [Gemmataceae bacterium]|nr:allophanate hydrolase subunit 1 [Gemmataceae bacterium]
MSHPSYPALEPMGDQGALARLPDEASAARWADAVRAAAPPWLLDAVQAYTTVAVFHDPALIGVRGLMAELASVQARGHPAEGGTLHLIPCCYALGPDLGEIAAHAGMSPQEAAALHASAEYVVHAIGFCPGFPYLGYLPSALCGMPRLPSPRLRVEPGSVGLTGRQT